MADDPLSIPEHTHDQDSDHSCPFCTITSTYQPISPLETTQDDWDPERLDPPTYVLLSTEHVVAFLDIAPLTRGHVLVAPRRHRVKVGNLTTNEAAELGRVLPLVARSVLASVFPDIPHHEADYNVVQNNGPGAAQVIPHVHVHIIPRPPLNYKPANGVNGNGRSAYAPSQIPTGLRASYVQFGRGQRHELDDDDAAVLVKTMRENLKREWQEEFGRVTVVPRRKEQKM